MLHSAREVTRYFASPGYPLLDGAMQLQLHAFGLYNLVERVVKDAEAKRREGGVAFMWAIDPEILRAYNWAVSWFEQARLNEIPIEQGEAALRNGSWLPEQSDLDTLEAILELLDVGIAQARSTTDRPGGRGPGGSS